MLKKYASIVYAPSDVVEVRCLHASQPVQSYWTTGAGLPGMYDQLKALNGQGYNIYAGVLPRKADGGKTDADTANGHVIWLDFDHVTDVDAWEADIDKAWPDMPQPTMTINSGHGVHVYWRLTDATDKDAISATNKGLLWTGADKACTNPGRIMRLPGFMNHKEPAAECTILSTTDATYNIADFTPFLSTQTQTDNAAWAIIPTTPSTIDTAVLRAKATEYIRKIPPVAKGGRNHELYKVACDVFDFGLSDEEVYDIISAWNQSNMPPLDDAEVVRVVKSASKNRQNKTPTKGNKSKTTATASAQPVKQKKPRKVIEFPAECYNVPGFVNDFQQYALSTAAAKCKLAAFAAGLAMQAMLIGQKTVLHAEEDTHSNCYIVLLAPSGSGKDAPRKVIKRIIEGVKALPECGSQHIQNLLDCRIGDTFASGQGCVTGISEIGSKLYLYDEIDKLLIMLADNKSSNGSWAATMQRTLLTMYSSATSTFFAPDYSDNRQRGPKTIANPNLCLYGTGTPGVFYESLTTDSLRNGFVGRLMAFESHEQSVRATMATKAQEQSALNPISTDAVFDRLVHTAHQWLKVDNPTSTVQYDRRKIPIAPDAIDIMTDTSNAAYAEIEAAREKHGEENVYSTVWSRYAENRNKLAMIYATSRGGLDNAVVDADCIRWADKVARYCCAMLCGQIESYVAENDFNRACKRLLRYIEAKGGDLGYRDIYRGLQMKVKDTKDIVKSLLGQGLVNVYTDESGKERIMLI